MQGSKVVCVGSATIDVFVLLHNLQKFSYDKFSNQISFPLGEKVPLDEYKLALGGNACNVSVGLSRLGFQATLAAEIGNDEFSKKIENSLSTENVDQALLNKKSRVTPYFNIILSYDGERTVLEEKVPSDQTVSAGNLNPEFIYLTSMVGDWEKVYEDAFTNNPNSKFALNLGPRQIDLQFEELSKMLSKIEVIFVNVGEAQEIIQDSSPDIKNMLTKLHSLGVKVAVVTDGRNGSYAIDSSSKMFQISTATQKKPVERTGAGDSYAAGFIFGLMNDQPIETCMKYGAINADSVIEKVGAQDGLLTKAGMEKQFEELPNLKAVEL